MTVNAISKEIGRTTVQTQKLLDKAQAVGIKVYCKPGQRLYDARSVEVVKAMLGQPHRKISAGTDDWLSEWIDQGGTNQ
jgi:hypothetical protein